jgi:hypothetical protein
MKIVAGIFATPLGMLLGAQRTLVPPPQLEQVAKAHHCSAVVSFVVDEESHRAASFEVHYGPPKAMRGRSFPTTS